MRTYRIGKREHDKTAETLLQGLDFDKTMPEVGQFVGMWPTVPDSGVQGVAATGELNTLNKEPGSSNDPAVGPPSRYR